MENERYDMLVQKYLSAKTTDEENKELLDALLRGLNDLKTEMRKLKINYDLAMKELEEDLNERD